MTRTAPSYTGYSIAAGVVWAVILISVSRTAGKATRDKFLLVFSGWGIGWLSATIGRAVYPPPRRRGATPPDTA